MPCACIIKSHSSRTAPPPAWFRVMWAAYCLTNQWLSEVAKYIEQDKTGATALSEAVAKRLRIDESQVLTQAQKTAVETTLNLGDTDTDFVAKFNQALRS